MGRAGIQKDKVGASVSYQRSGHLLLFLHREEPGASSNRLFRSDYCVLHRLPQSPPGGPVGALALSLPPTRVISSADGVGKPMSLRARGRCCQSSPKATKPLLPPIGSLGNPPGRSQRQHGPPSMLCNPPPPHILQTGSALLTWDSPG